MNKFNTFREKIQALLKEREEKMKEHEETLRAFKEQIDELRQNNND